MSYQSINRKETIMSAADTIAAEANKNVTIAFYKQALLEGDVENAFRTYAGPTYSAQPSH